MQTYPVNLRLSYILLPMLIVLFGMMQSDSFAGENQPVMGAGPSTAVAELFFKHFSALPEARGYEFIVEPRSIKHAGGIQASGKYLFGRTGRPLNKREKALNKRDLTIARIPLGFVVGEKTGIKHINLRQLEDIYSRRVTNWKALGGTDAKIILAGREPTEAALSVIQQDYPFFREAEFDLVLSRDHQMVNLFKSPMGDHAIGFGAKSNFDEVHLLTVDGFRAGVSLGLVYDARNMNHPVIKAAIAFAGSEAWRQRVLEAGFLAPDGATR